MFDIFMERVKRLITSRLFPIVLVYLLLFSVLINRIFVIQIVEGEEHAIDVEQKTTKERELKSTRGNILDRNGKLLAYNELSYSVILEDTGELETNEDKNSMIYKIIKIVEGNGGLLASDFFIQMNEDGSLSFKKGGSSELSFKRDVYSLSSVDDLTDEQKASTAQDIFNYLRHGDGSTTAMYDISDDYSMEEALKIMMIRFNIVMNKYSRYLPITIASNVNAATVASIKESSEELPGVQVLTESHRVYKDSEYFAHILGYTGLISQDKLEELQADGNSDYSATDQIGITGIEKEYEEYLHGKNGSETVVVNEQTRVLDILSTDQPQAGNDVYLTIDADLQMACTDLLEKRIAGILLGSIKTNQITIFDVYYALINNSVIDISRFNEDDATALEKSVYNTFEVEQKEVFKELKNVLAINNTTSYKSLPEDMQEYVDYIYSMLGKEKILLTGNMDSEDEKLKEYNSGKISFSEFLKYAISNNYIDLDKLDVGKEYFSTEELYEKLLTLIFNILKDDSSFNKKIYKDLVYSYKLSGKEICLLLFDQSVLEYDEKEISGLEQGTVSPQSFIQKKIRDLKITPGQLALEPCSGSVVVTDVKTGDVLALVTYPSYDNNKFANRVDPEYFSKLNNDKAYPMVNRPLQQKTAPGSTYKMVTSVAGLEEGVIGPSEQIYDEHTFTGINPGPSCWSRASHGKVDVPNALEVSCNYFYYEVGFRLGRDLSGNYNSNLGLEKLKKYATEFGFTEPSGIELSEYDPKISDWDAVRSAIGQGTNNYTPAQLSRYVTAVSNGGTVFNLTVLNKIVDLDKKVIKNNKATIYNNVNIKDSTWNLVHEGMYKVVNGEDSSIKPLFKDFGDLVVAGKTGTAQESKTKPNHALFVSYAPFDNPEISVVAVIPNGYTSSNAAELARDVYKYYFKLDGYKDMLKSKVTLPEIAGHVSD